MPEILSLQDTMNGDHTDLPPAHRIDSGRQLEAPAPSSSATPPIASFSAVDQHHANDPPPDPAIPSQPMWIRLTPVRPRQTMSPTPPTTSAQNPCFLTAPAPDAPPS